MAGIPFDMIGFVTSILGIFGLIPLVWMLVLYQLPQYKLKQLDATIEETTALLETAVQNGFVPGPKFVQVVEAHLRIFRDLTEDVRAQVACARGFRAQCLAAIGGLSRRIGRISGRVGLIRTRIAVTSDQERRKAEAGSRRNDPSPDSPFSSGQREQDESLNDDDELFKYEDLETLDLPESIAPPFEPPNVAIPPPMYSVHTASVQYQPFRDRGAGAVDSETLGVQRGLAIPDFPSLAISAPPRYPLDHCVTQRSDRGSLIFSTPFLSPESSQLPSQLNQMHPLANAVAGAAQADMHGHLPQTSRDDIQTILMEFKHQLLADQRDMIISSMQNILDGALQRTIQVPSRV